MSLTVSDICHTRSTSHSISDMVSFSTVALVFTMFALGASANEGELSTSSTGEQPTDDGE